MSETAATASSSFFRSMLDANASSSKMLQVGKAVLIVAGIVFIIGIIRWLYRQYKVSSSSKTWILQGTKAAKKGLVVQQDPTKPGSASLHRSDNQAGGLEFSYSMWIFIEDWSYKYGEWKHVMHKGNDNSWPNRAPGIWLHPTENKMRVYMNTFAKVDEHVDVENLPLNKWFHVVVAVRQKDLDVYINGNLAKRKHLDGVPKQNFGDVYLNSFRGFGGFLSNVQYRDSYMSFAEIDQTIQDGPSTAPCADTKELPPYFSQNWWANSK